ncbi:MAG: pilus assembly protein TadG-related protein, partial [Candidatus Nanopelagicales bacterium]
MDRDRGRRCGVVANRLVHDDRGVGTVLGVILGVAVLSSGIVVGALVSVHVTHQRASVAADLAALAAAAHG